jgi:hypothetical protein
MAATVLTAACGDGDAESVRSDEPPWGLTGIEMPDTEAEVIAVLQALPGIDGRQPTFEMDEDFSIASAIYDESEEEGAFGVVINAAPDSAPLESFAAFEATGGNIEASAGDPDGDLIWMAFGPSPEDEFESFALWWADPDGSWGFLAVADTAEVRIELVHAFITAAGG